MTAYRMHLDGVEKRQDCQGFERERARADGSLDPDGPDATLWQSKLSPAKFTPAIVHHPQRILSVVHHPLSAVCFGSSGTLSAFVYLTYPVLLVHQICFIYRYPTLDFLSRNKYHIHHEVPSIVSPLSVFS